MNTSLENDTSRVKRTCQQWAGGDVGDGGQHLIGLDFRCTKRHNILPCQHS